MNDDYTIFDENEENIEDEMELDVSKFNQAVIWGTDWTTETIARQLEKGNINLNPIFQRRDAWTNQEKSRLIESLILGLPVPPIILAESKGKKNSYIVIDGKQRLLSIRRFYSKITDKEFKNKEVDVKSAFKQLKLSGLDILKNLNGYTYQDISSRDSEYANNLDNQAIRTIVIKNWPEESFLYTVFLRLNTGSKKLSSQELRQALNPGPFLTFLDEVTADSPAIRKMLNNTEADSRMRDVELALRYYGFRYYMTKYDGRLKEFLDYTCGRLNKAWEENGKEIENDFKKLESAINFVFDIIPSEAPFSRVVDDKWNNRFNRSIFELFTFYFSNSDICSCVRQDKEKFIELFKKLNNDFEFIAAISNTTKNKNKLIKRYELFSRVLLQLPSIVSKQIAIQSFRLVNERIVVSE